VGEAAEMMWEHDFRAGEFDEYCERHKITYSYGHSCGLCEDGEPPVFDKGDKVMFAKRCQKTVYPMKVDKVNGKGEVFINNRWWRPSSFIPYKLWKIESEY